MMLGRARHAIAVAFEPLAVIAGVFTIVGVALLVQPERFARTPSYGDLLDLLSTQQWGALYLAAAVLMGTSLASRSKALDVIGHTAATMLVSAWWVAFAIRFATDDSTTVVNPVMWGVLFYVTGLSVIHLDGRWDARAGSGT